VETSGFAERCTQCFAAIASLGADEIAVLTHAPRSD
jgi:hypothetical protein